LLHIYAPAAGDPSTPGERKLYDKQIWLLRRSHALCLPPFGIITAIRSWLLHPPSAEAVALASLPENVSWSAIVVYQGLQPKHVLVARFAVSAVMLAYAGLPQLRGAYARHGLVVLRTYSVLLFLLFPALTEWHVRHVLRSELCLPLLPGHMLIALLTVHSAFVPLPLRDSLALLAARWILMCVARVTGAPVWPRPKTLLHLSSLLATVLHVICATILVVRDRRAWATWRSARRARLAESYGRFKAAEFA
jgi:hypothetical protein